MAFITKADLETYVDSYTLDQITGSNDNLIDDCILDSEEAIKEYLRHRYDVTVEFAKVDGDRNRTLLKHTIAVAIFYVFERIPSNVVPQSREDSYNRAIQWAKDIQKGLIDVDLQALDPQTGYNIRFEPGSKSKSYRW